MTTSLKLTNMQKFYDFFTPTQEGHHTPTEIMMILEKKVKNVKYFIDLNKIETIEYKEGGYVLFDLRDFQKDNSGDSTVVYEFITTAS